LKKLILTFIIFSLIYTPIYEEDFIISEPTSHFDRSLNFPSRSFTHVREMEITAYTVAPEECGKDIWEEDYGVTASGKVVQEGYVAAGHGIPLGTKLFIEGIGEVTVEDRGVPEIVHNGVVDVFKWSKKEAIEFGRQVRKVYFLTDVEMRTIR
jgi:3D (Asp-Asp-Asp) domain-containing protein